MKRSLSMLFLPILVSISGFSQSYIVYSQPTSVKAPALPYGVEDIVKLSRAGVNDDVILRYIDARRISYQLEADDVIFLRDQGVSDPVIHAMLDQKIQLMKQPPAAAPPVTSTPALAGSAPAVHECPLDCARCGNPLFADSQELKRPVSTLHIIPFTSALAPSSARWGWRPFSFYGPWIPECGWWLYDCGHWHGCRPWLPCPRW